MIATNKLRGRMVCKGYTLRDVADILNMHQSTLSRQIANKSRMSIETLSKLCELLEIKDSEIAEYFFVGQA